MFRYVALIWDAQDSQQVDAAQAATRRLKASSSQWQEALDRPRLRVFCADMRPGSLEPRVLAGKAGVVLGSLFARKSDLEDETPAQACALDEARTAAIVDSRGEWLVRNGWGNYVAFIADPLTGHTWVLNDPCGSLPCFSTTFRGITIVFSAIADCMELGSLRFTVNRRFIERRSYGGDMTQQWDALNEVTQIRRGECAEFSPRRQPAMVSRRFLWNPVDFARTHEPLDDPSVAAMALRSTLLSCTSTLAACHESALLRLSGGLDSSIVLACLQSAPRRPRVLAYTHFTSNSPLDPRRWARMAAGHAGCEHIELESTAADIQLSAILDIAPTAEPFSTLMCLVTAAHEQGLLARQGASATFTGDGGDCAFGSFCIGEAATAYLRRHGPRPAVVRLAAESASILRQTTWHALKRALQMWLTGRSLTSLTALNHEARKLVTEDVVRECEATPSIHPWLARPAARAVGADQQAWSAARYTRSLLRPGASECRWAGDRRSDLFAAADRAGAANSCRRALHGRAGSRSRATRVSWRRRGADPESPVEGSGRRFPRAAHSAQPRLAARDLPRRRARRRRVAGPGSGRARARARPREERGIPRRAAAPPGY